MDTERAILAEQLILKNRILANQSAPDEKQLEAAGAIWAEELIHAGIPPRHWGEMFKLARQARPSSSKAFMVTIDQVIDAWEHYLRGNCWIFEEEAWDQCHVRVILCGECQDGYVWHKKVDDRNGSTRQLLGECFCVINQRARNSYRFRRFSAAYEIRHGEPYKPSRSDLISLHESRIGDLIWDSAVDEYVSDAETQALKGFCEYLRKVAGER